MNIEYYIDQLWTSKFALPVAIISLALIIILIVNWRKLRHRWFEWRTLRCLNAIGIRQMKNVICPDGIDGNFKIDRLVMLHDSILLIAFKPYSGNIYCADNIPEWTQVVGQKSYKFGNPLFELENQITAIKNIVSSASVRGVLFFDHNAKFPKGHPDKVLTPGNIPDYFIRPKCPEPRPEILQTWEALLKLSIKDNRSVQLQI
jgi:hypothetical protein